jgi:hypothetical protein
MSIPTDFCLAPDGRRALVIFGKALSWRRIYRDSTGPRRFLPGAFTEALVNGPHYTALTVDHGGPELGSTDDGRLRFLHTPSGLQFFCWPPEGTDPAAIVGRKPSIGFTVSDSRIVNGTEQISAAVLLEIALVASNPVASDGWMRVEWQDARRPPGAPSGLPFQ